MGKLKKLIEQFLNQPPEVSFEDVRYLLEAFGFEEKRSREHPNFTNCPQTSSLRLHKQSLPPQAGIKSAQADFVFIAAISNRHVFLQKWDAPKGLRVATVVLEIHKVEKLRYPKKVDRKLREFMSSK